MAEKVEKSLDERIKQVYDLATEHFGDCRFVGIKYHNKMGWIAKVQFNGDFENLVAEGKDATDAIKNLRNRVKKIIKRYNGV